MGEEQQQAQLLAEVQAENSRLCEANSELEQTYGQAEAQNSQLKRELTQATDDADRLSQKTAR